MRAPVILMALYLSCGVSLAETTASVNECQLTSMKLASSETEENHSQEGLIFTGRFNNLSFKSNNDCLENEYILLRISEKTRVRFSKESSQIIAVYKVAGFRVLLLEAREAEFFQIAYSQIGSTRIDAKLVDRSAEIPSAATIEKVEYTTSLTFQIHVGSPYLVATSFSPNLQFRYGLRHEFSDAYVMFNSDRFSVVNKNSGASVISGRGQAPLISPGGRYITAVGRDGHFLYLWDTYFPALAPLEYSVEGAKIDSVFWAENDEHLVIAYEEDTGLWNVSAALPFVYSSSFRLIDRYPTESSFGGWLFVNEVKFVLTSAPYTLKASRAAPRQSAHDSDSEDLSFDELQLDLDELLDELNNDESEVQSMASLDPGSPFFIDGDAQILRQPCLFFPLTPVFEEKFLLAAKRNRISENEGNSLPSTKTGYYCHSLFERNIWPKRDNDQDNLGEIKPNELDPTRQQKSLQPKISALHDAFEYEHSAKALLERIVKLKGFERESEAESLIDALEIAGMPANNASVENNIFGRSEFSISANLTRFQLLSKKNRKLETGDICEKLGGLEQDYTHPYHHVIYDDRGFIDYDELMILIATGPEFVSAAYPLEGVDNSILWVIKKECTHIGSGEIPRRWITVLSERHGTLSLIDEDYRKELPAFINDSLAPDISLKAFSLGESEFVVWFPRIGFTIYSPEHGLDSLHRYDEEGDNDVEFVRLGVRRSFCMYNKSVNSVDCFLYSGVERKYIELSGFFVFGELILLHGPSGLLFGTEDAYQLVELLSPNGTSISRLDSDMRNLRVSSFPELIDRTQSRLLSLSWQLPAIKLDGVQQLQNGRLRVRLKDESTFRSDIAGYKAYANGIPIFVETLKEDVSGRELLLELPTQFRSASISVAGITSNGFSTMPKTVTIGSETLQGRLFFVPIVIDEYEDKNWNKIRFGQNDARKLGRILSQEAPETYSEAGIVLRDIHNSRTPIEDFRRSLQSDDISEKDTLFLYWSGHGFRGDDGESYFAVPNTPHPEFGEPGRTQNLAISSRALIEVALSFGFGRIVLIIDACHSTGAYFENFHEAFSAELATHTMEPSVVLFGSSRSREASLEIGEGVFTRSLIDSIQDRSRTDTDQDGVLSLEEVYNQVKFRTLSRVRRVNRIQTPIVKRFNFFGDFIFI